MALLDSGSVSYTGTTATVNVAVTAGAGNRKLIVGFSMEAVVNVTALTFNTQDLLALSPVEDRAQDGFARCIIYEQFEAGLPASGSHAIAATFSASATGGGRMFYWLVDDVRQDQLAEGDSGALPNSGSSLATWQTDGTYAAGDDDRVLCAVCYRNDNATSIVLSTPSGATHIDASGFTVAGGGRVNGSIKVGSMGTGTVRPAWTTQATGAQRRIGASAMLNPITSAALTATAAFQAQSATSDADAVVGHPATAAFQAQSATSNATLVRARQASAAFQAQAASSAAAAVLGHPASATFQAQSATSNAEVAVDGDKAIIAAFQAQSATSAAAAVVGHPATAAFQAQSASSNAEVEVERIVNVTTAAFQAQPATTSIRIHVPPLPPQPWNSYRPGRARPSNLW